MFLRRLPQLLARVQTSWQPVSLPLLPLDSVFRQPCAGRSLLPLTGQPEELFNLLEQNAGDRRIQ